MTTDKRKSQLLQALNAIDSNLVLDGNIDIEALLSLNGDRSYQLMWSGRRKAFSTAEEKENIALEKIRGSGRDWLIRGDNLKALKALQASHTDRVDVIIIDPPYNTGKRFTYNDNFKGRDRKKGRHDDWLSMMTPRLILARKLLVEDGCLFVHIGDDELANLKLLLEELFGEENVLGILTWVKKKKGSHLSKSLRSITEYIVVVAKDKSKLNLYGEPAYSDKWQPLAKKTNRLKTLSFDANTVESKLPDGEHDPKNRSGLLEFKDHIHIKAGRVSNAFSVIGPFVWTQKKLDQEIALGTKVALSKRFGFNVFRHDQAQKFKRPITLLDKNRGIGSYEDAFEELHQRLGVERLFTYAKPTSLLRHLIRAGSHFKPDALIMDFFAGSGSLGEAVWQTNAETGSSKRFILVQQTSPVVDERFETIADICEARLKAAQPTIDGAELPTIWRMTDE